MVQIQLTAIINKEPEVIFDAVASHYVENLPKWNPDITKFERVDAGPIKAGSRIDEEQNIKGRKYTRIVEVTVYKPNELFAVKNVPEEPPKEKYSTVYTFEAVPEGTRLTQTSSFEIYNWFFKLFGPLFLNKIIKKDVSRNFYNLLIPD